jgi:uncharacterized protein YecE (DUF72 family)
VEINSSFYRFHQPKTYARWAASVPQGFAFAVKVPRLITHQSRLRDLGGMEEFLTGVSELGEKLGLLLIQLPPSLAFDEDVGHCFFAELRQRFTGGVVCEPRHVSWFSAQAEALLIEFRIARAIVDPPTAPQASQPGGWEGLRYYRLHGSPRRYVSSYSEEALHKLAVQLSAEAQQAETWCIFNNTARGAAMGNALALLEMLGSSDSRLG